MKKPLILITRPRADAEAFAARLEAMGYASLIEPLLTIMPLAARVEAGNARALLITSRHALPAITPLYTLPLFAVGDEAAALAHELGFSRVTHAPTAAVLLENISPAYAPLLYARGQDISLDAVATLAMRGIAMREIVVYTAQTATAFSATARAAFKGGDIAVIPFFSARTADTFAQLIAYANLAEALRFTHAVVISTRAAEALAHLPWKSLSISASPDADSLADTIDKRLRGR